MCQSADVLFYVVSAPVNFLQRRIVRNGWGKANSVNGPSYLALFMLAIPDRMYNSLDREVQIAFLVSPSHRIQKEQKGNTLCVTSRDPIDIYT